MIHAVSVYVAFIAVLIYLFSTFLIYLFGYEYKYSKHVSLAFHIILFLLTNYWLARAILLNDHTNALFQLPLLSFWAIRLYDMVISFVKKQLLQS